MDERDRLSIWFFLIAALLFQAAATVLGKMAALRMGVPTLGAFLRSGWYLGELGCLILQAFFWQFALRRVRLFVAYLFMSLNYLLVLAASRIFFLEHVTSLNIIGAAVVTSGVYLVVREDLP